MKMCIVSVLVCGGACVYVCVCMCVCVCVCVGGGGCLCVCVGVYALRIVSLDWILRCINTS